MPVKGQQPIDVDVHFVGDTINLVVPKQPGLDFEDAAPRLQALADDLQVTYGKSVEIVTGPERHLHGPEQGHVHEAGRAHAH
jgi:hypothetical protein